jgi:hypothetical protein
MGKEIRDKQVIVMTIDMTQLNPEERMMLYSLRIDVFDAYFTKEERKRQTRVFFGNSKCQQPSTSFPQQRPPSRLRPSIVMNFGSDGLERENKNLQKQLHAKGTPRDGRDD